VKPSFQQLTSYGGVEHRCFPLDDMWLGPCQLLAAMIADEAIADMWETGAFEAFNVDECPSQHRQSFDRLQARAMSHGHASIWAYNIRRYYS